MLNLLPVTQKRALASHVLYEQIRQVSITVLSVGLVLSGLMLSADRLMQMWYQALSHETAVNVSETDRLALADLVDQTSATSQAVLEIRNRFFHPLTDVQIVLQNTPNATVHIHHIEIDYLTGKMSLQGIAQNRAVLVDYQHTLETIPALTQVNFPLNDLNQRDQINFTASAILSHEISSN